jgi:hypothetical protein
MPEELERKLKREANEKFPDDPRRQDRYIYDTLRRAGWKPFKRKKLE